MSNLAKLKMRQEDARSAAVRTLEALGYTYNGAELWKPPMGNSPDFDLIDSLRAEVERLQAKHAETLGRESVQRTLRTESEVERDRLKAENEALRKIISECATACGAGCHQECSLEFMAMLPDEIASVVGKRARNAAIGAVVWQFIDRMTDVCEQDPAERILEQFVAAVRPAIDAALEGGGK